MESQSPEVQADRKTANIQATRGAEFFKGAFQHGGLQYVKYDMQLFPITLDRKHPIWSIRFIYSIHATFGEDIVPVNVRNLFKILNLGPERYPAAMLMAAIPRGLFEAGAWSDMVVQGTDVKNIIHAFIPTIDGNFAFGWFVVDDAHGKSIENTLFVPYPNNDMDMMKDLVRRLQFTKSAASGYHQNPKPPETDFMRQLKAEKTMKIGDPVMAFWSAGSGGHFHGKGVITDIREKSIVVGLVEEIRTYSSDPKPDPDYPKGYHITIPRVLSKAWKHYLRFEPTSIPLFEPKPAAAPKPTTTPINQKLAYALVDAFEKKFSSDLSYFEILDHAGLFMGNFYVKYFKIRFPQVGIPSRFFTKFNLYHATPVDTIIVIGAYISAISEEAGWGNAIETTDVLDDWGIIQSPVGQIIINNKITRNAGLFLLKSKSPLPENIKPSEMEMFRSQIRDDLGRLVKQGLLKPLTGPSETPTGVDETDTFQKLVRFFTEESPEPGTDYDVDDIYHLINIPVDTLTDFFKDLIAQADEQGKPRPSITFKQYFEKKFNIKIGLSPETIPEPPKEPEENPAAPVASKFVPATESDITQMVHMKTELNWKEARDPARDNFKLVTGAAPLSMTSTEPKDDHLYVHLIERHPKAPKVPGIGVATMVNLVKKSIGKGFKGRLKLEGIQKAEGFYDKIGMKMEKETNLGHMFSFDARTGQKFAMTGKRMLEGKIALNPDLMDADFTTGSVSGTAEENPASSDEIAKAKKVVHRFTAFEAKNVGTTKLDALNKKTRRLNSWNTALYSSNKWSGKEKGYYHPWGDHFPRSVFITEDESHVIGIGQAVVKPDGINDMPIYKGKNSPTLEQARRVKVWAKLADTLGMDLPCKACGTTLHYEEDAGWVCDKCKGPSEPKYKITGGPVLYDAESQILISIGKIRKSGD